MDCLDPLNLSITRDAEVLGVSRLTLSNLINGKTAFLRKWRSGFTKAFGGSAEVWLRMQMAYELAQAEKADQGETRGAQIRGCRVSL
jgi:addiction module HigA family antidote